MTTEIVPAVSTADLCELRQLWPQSLLSEMSKRQTDLEMQRRFSGLQAGTCSYCGRHIVNSMTRHMTTYHLDLGQLWRCPVAWCSHWKGMPQDCIYHIHRHQTRLSIKASNLGKWFPPWTMTRTAWKAALKPKVSGVATDVILFSPTGPPLPGVWRLCHASFPSSNVYGQVVRLHTLGLCRGPLGGQDSNTESVSSPSHPAQSSLGPTHRTMSLPPGRLHVPRHLQRRLMKPTFSLFRC